MTKEEGRAISAKERVVVAGAGFAGLRCAQSLREAGVEALVLEARDRVGGRVWSQAPFGEEGGVIERGAEFVLRGYERLTSLLAAHDLALAPMGMSYGAREPRGGEPTTLAAMRRVAEEVGRRAARADARASAADVFAGVGEELDDPAALAAFRARFETSAAADAREIAASVLTGAASSMSTEESRRVAGGNQLLARRLAASLGDRVLLRRAVVEVRDEGASVVLTVEEADGGRTQLEAAVCVLALPLPHASRLLGRRRLAPGVAELIEAMGLGIAAKLHVPLARPPAPSAVMDVPGRWWSWTACDGRDGVAPVAHAFVGGRQALAALRVEEGPATWAMRLRRRLPDLDLREQEAVLTTWHDDPWALCAYSHRRPGAAPTLSAPQPRAAVSAPPPESGAPWPAVTGRLVLAGEWTAGDWHGLMEGALRSGERAAREALTLLRGGSATRSAAW